MLNGLGLDAGWTYVGVLATGVATLLVPALAIRRTGASGYGTFVLVVGAATLIAPFETGLSMVGRRAAALASATPDAPTVDRERARLLAVRDLFVCLTGGIVLMTVAGVLLVIATVIPGGKAVAILVALLGLSVALNSASGVEQAILFGQRRFRTTAAAAVLGTAATCSLLPFAMSQYGVVGLGAATAVGTAIHRGVVFTAVHVESPWLPLSPRRRADRSLVRAVAADTAPLVLVGIGGHVVATTDVFVLGATTGAGVVGIYRAASLLPTQIASVLFRGYDTVFPALAAEGNDEQERAIRLLTRVFSYGSGLILGVVMMTRHFIVRVLTGSPSALASDVMWIFCVVWGVNAAAHGLALLLVARGEQRVFAPLVIVEAALNVLLTIVLVRYVGAIGAAWATLLTLCVSNAIVLPLITRANVRISTISLVADGLGALSVGGIVSALAVTAVDFGELGGWPRFLVSCTAVAALGGLVGAMLAGTSTRREFAGAFRRPAR